MKKNIIILILALVLCALLFQAQNPYWTQTNAQLKGWVFGKDANFAGERAWGTTGTADTLVISGVDTTCAVFLTPKTTQIENLYYDIKSAGDTVFVTADSAGTASTDKYSYMIIRNAYGATD